ncbi:NnrS family protein [Alkalilacustris brevis]|uniref:NnrS family protein n=1 Tax=Alkalilacustris brevis TaxID=2026338 RepID=UPI000E0DA40B|nr:NnrS family protein [Alkalilacustris brevis]
MPSTSQTIRAWNGPTLLSYGYRPFFLFGAIWAALAMALWVWALAGGQVPAPAFSHLDWHVHGMLFGYPMAVVAGFLMTAVPNWTGRFPIVGWPLAVLVALWLAGRVAVTAPAGIGPVGVALIDLAFPLALGAAMLREIVAGRNWRNLKVLALLALIALGNGLFHWEAAQGLGAQGWGARLGLAGLIALITLIGGRIVPSFTRNWLAARGPGPLPAAAGGVDNAVMAVTLLALALWAALPGTVLAGLACLLAGVANLARLARWQGLRCGAEPLVWVLHAGYAFVPLGFLAIGAQSLGAPGTASAAQHVWMAGAVGLMTLAVMSRASLGHAGLPLAAGRGVALLYLALIGSVAARFLHGLFPLPATLHLAGALWITAFAGFALLYWPILARPRRAQRQANAPRSVARRG